MSRWYLCKYMKVAYLIGSLNRGGAETLLLDIFRKADEASFEMMLIHRKGGMYEQEFERVTPKHYKIAPNKWHQLSYLRQLRRLFKDEHVTLIHAFYRLDAVYAWIATIGMRIPIVITFDGYKGSECGWRRGLLYRLVMQIAKKLCFVSGEQMRSYERRYGEIVRRKGIVLYNGLNFDKFELTSKETNELKSGRRVKLCMVGNFNSVRSQIVVAKALKLIDNRKELKDKFDFYFIGGRYKGEEFYYDQCVEFCKEHRLNNVHFLGVRDDIPVLLKTMDGFVYSSNNDTFGIAVIEAIAMALPIVVNDHPVMKEVCGEANDGVRYFRTEDVGSAADTIVAMVTNMEQSKQAAKANAVMVHNKYSIHTHIQNVYSIYQLL